MKRHDVSDIKVKERLQTLSVKLRKRIEPRYGLLNHLVSSRVLTDEEKQKIMASSGSYSYSQCDKLLNIMQGKTPEDCRKFLDSLNSTGQKHVLNFIVENARRFDSCHNQFCYWPLEKIHRERITSNWAKLVEKIDCKYTNLIDALSSCDCINTEQSQIIKGAQTNEKMTDELLTMLLRRSIRDYNEFVKCLEESNMSHVVQEIHLDIGPGGDVTSSDVTDAQNPVPLFSSLAVSSSSASAALLKSFQSSVPSKELPETVASQASSQQADVTDSKTTERQLHMSKSTASEPLSQTDVITTKKTEQQLNGNLLFTLPRPPTASDGVMCNFRVFGVSIVGKKVYVVYDGRGNIYEYDENSVTDVIKVGGMTSARDMVADSERGMLFVCDFRCGVIWRVSLDTREIKMLAKFNKPRSLSLLDTRLLVTLQNSMVMVNSLTGDEIRKIPSPKDTSRGKPWHSIESERGTIITCYQKSVIEINFNGDEIQASDNTCYHLALHSVGQRLIVADYSLNRIFVLNEKLKFQKILFDKEKLDNEHPSRVNYDKTNNRLVVGLHNGYVKIFEC